MVTHGIFSSHLILDANKIIFALPLKQSWRQVLKETKDKC